MPEEHLRIYKKRKHIMVDNFLGGIAWGLGTVVGISVLAVFIGFLVSKVNVIPVIGQWLADTLRQAQPISSNTIIR